MVRLGDLMEIKDCCYPEMIPWRRQGEDGILI